jgi:hypothetical protein
VPPAALVFHVSRCGSTLLARQLGATGRLRVVSEPVVLSQALRLAWPMAVVDGEADLTVPPAVDGAGGPGTALVRGVLAALGSACASPWILKADTWYAFYATALRALFPGVPVVFVHRDAAAVLDSLRRKPPGGDPERFRPDVVHGVYEAIAAQLDRPPAGAGPTVVVDYADLPQAVPDRVAPALGLPAGPAARAAMLAAAAVESWHPDRPWRPAMLDVPDEVRDIAAPIEEVRRRIIAHAVPDSRLAEMPS